MRKDDAKPGSRRPFDLTPREKEALGYYEQGLTNSEIAVKMGIRTVSIRNTLIKALEKRAVGGNDK